ncbi:hypothetical protein HK096_006431 [Nowakowskiella sp. JEL0078]|nr:hypothetical protein HK096_006431 [Nowakowskiella sp. JEL0078]
MDSENLPELKIRSVKDNVLVSSNTAPQHGIQFPQTAPVSVVSLPPPLPLSTSINKQMLESLILSQHSNSGSEPQGVTVNADFFSQLLGVLSLVVPDMAGTLQRNILDAQKSPVLPAYAKLDVQDPTLAPKQNESPGIAKSSLSKISVPEGTRVETSFLEKAAEEAEKQKADEAVYVKAQSEAINDKEIFISLLERKYESKYSDLQDLEQKDRELQNEIKEIENGIEELQRTLDAQKERLKDANKQVVKSLESKKIISDELKTQTQNIEKHKVRLEKIRSMNPSEFSKKFPLSKETSAPEIIRNEIDAAERNKRNLLEARDLVSELRNAELDVKKDKTVNSCIRIIEQKKNNRRTFIKSHSSSKSDPTKRYSFDYLKNGRRRIAKKEPFSRRVELHSSLKNGYLGTNGTSDEEKPRNSKIYVSNDELITRNSEVKGFGDVEIPRNSEDNILKDEILRNSKVTSTTNVRSLNKNGVEESQRKSKYLLNATEIGFNNYTRNSNYEKSIGYDESTKSTKSERVARDDEISRNSKYDKRNMTDILSLSKISGNMKDGLSTRNSRSRSPETPRSWNAYGIAKDLNSIKISRMESRDSRHKNVNETDLLTNSRTSDKNSHNIQNEEYPRTPDSLGYKRGPSPSRDFDQREKRIRGAASFNELGVHNSRELARNSTQKLIPMEDICLNFNKHHCNGFAGNRCSKEHVCIVCSGPHFIDFCDYEREICLHFNSEDNCKNLDCEKEHRCLLCALTDHGITKCRVPMFLESPKEQYCYLWNSVDENSPITCSQKCDKTHRCLRCGGEHAVVICPLNVDNYAISERELKKKNGFDRDVKEKTKVCRIICKDFNNDGCHWKICKFRHICNICFSSNHSHENCPKNSQMKQLGDRATNVEKRFQKYDHKEIPGQETNDIHDRISEKQKEVSEQLNNRAENFPARYKNSPRKLKERAKLATKHFFESIETDPRKVLKTPTENKPRDSITSRIENRLGKRLEGRLGNRIESRVERRIEDRIGRRQSENWSEKRSESRYGQKMKDRIGQKIHYEIPDEEFGEIDQKTEIKDSEEREFYESKHSKGSWAIRDDSNE